MSDFPAGMLVDAQDGDVTVVVVSAADDPGRHAALLMTAGYEPRDGVWREAMTRDTYSSVSSAASGIQCA